uniref:Uncharacterized protein n=1 Tax=Eucampia antarctica TaxID=49252 RepID=A0A7S2W2J2_9STRA|mmetsp:Transcript_18253/g.17608  ORF Transcript_18253/g.17608 Transcript_18253/m.17608 type:complete len:231 (+) Transcript_18253:1-693(+)
MSTQKKLNTQLLNVCEEMYFKGLCNRHTGYTTVTLLQLIHLYTNFGVVTPSDLEENYKRIIEPYDSTKTIETLFAQIEDSVEYADAGNSRHNTSQSIGRTDLLIFNTMMCIDACREWRKTIAVDKLWSNFKRELTHAYRDLITQQLIDSNRYNQANPIIQKFEARTNCVLERIEFEILNINGTDYLIQQCQSTITQLANTVTDITSPNTTVNILKRQIDNLQVGRGTTET